MADGTVKTVNKDNDADFFYALPWSYGTLGNRNNSTLIGNVCKDTMAP